MADVITRFKLETTQYDSKLRDAAKELSKISKEAMSAGKSFNDFTQKNVEAARAFGKTESGAKNTKDKMRDLVGAFNDAAKAYNNLTEDQKKSDFGKALSQSLTQLQARIKKTKKELYGLDRSMSKGGSLGGVIEGIAGRFGMSSQMFTAAGAAVAGAGLAFKLAGDNISTALNFEKSMSMLSSLTGKTGKDLETLKEYAIELGSTSTLTASQVADAFRMIGSQQPQLLESSEALKEVTKNAITLSEAAGIDLATAAQTLSVSVNQMGGDSSLAASFVNVLAAASQKGAGDIAWLGEAITKSGTTAKAVGTSYEELVANLEMLAKAGYDASTAGTALRSIIMNLEKQSNSEYKPSVVGLTQAFDNLNKANLTLTNYQEIAGKMFAAQAKALAEAAGEAANLKEQITGTNIAEEQARTNTDNLDGALKGLSSAWEGLNLHLNSSNGLLRDTVDWLKGVVVWVDKAMIKLDKLYEASGGIMNDSDQQYNDTERKNQQRLQQQRDANKNIARDMYNRMGVLPAGAPASWKAEFDAEKKGGGGSGGGTGKGSGGKRGGRGGGGTTHVLTEEQTIAKQIQDLTQEYIHATDERKTAIRSEIATLQERQKVIKQMKDEALGKTYTPVTDINKPGQGVSVMSGIDIKLPETISALSPLEAMNKELERTQELMMKAASPEEWEILNEHLESVKKNIEDFQGGGKQQANEAKNVTKSWQAASSAISSVGSALQSLEDPSARVFGIIAQAIASVAQGFAGALASPATTSEGIWAWIAAAAAGTATMISTIASIKSATSGNFAEGGIVPGNSYSGDNIRAYGLNSGELILNRSQQDSIASQLQDGGMQNLRLSATVTGDQIRLVLNNNGKRKGFGEQLTFKNG